MPINNQKTWKLLAQIQQANKDVVFVGGVAEMMQGKKDSVKDIDICVLNLDGLEVFGEIKEWETKSPTSISGKRAGIENGGFIIDIFIEDELPEYVEILGLKFVTIEAMKKCYKKVIKELNDPSQCIFKEKMVEKLKKIQE